MEVRAIFKLWVILSLLCAVGAEAARKSKIKAQGKESCVASVAGDLQSGPPKRPIAVSFSQKLPQVTLAADEWAALAAETTQKVSEIAQARVIAQRYGAKLATYGGTSREILDFVRERVRKLGGAQAYRSWLRSQERVHLLDWHKISSDLDLMIIPNEGGASLSPERAQRIKELRGLLADAFPGDGFYKNFDLTVPSEFFERFPADQEHIEGISNIPITEDGIEALPQLEVRSSARGKINLARWGIEQYAANQLDFEIVPGFAEHKLRGDAFGNFRQVLRWIRYASANPDVPLSAASKKSIHDLLEATLRTHKQEILELLKQGHKELRNATSGQGRGAKIIEALEKLQLYSKDSVYTRALLEEFGIAELADEAGIKDARILEPLPYGELLPPEKWAASDGKDPVLVRHRAPLAAVQNIGGGALWISNERAIIQGRTTMAALGPGLYTSEGAGSWAYGDFSVRLELNPHAVEGRDYVNNGGIYILKTQNAIARNPDGSFKVAPITMAEIQVKFFADLRHVASELKPGEPASFAAASLMRGLAQTIRPELHADEMPAFTEAAALAKKLNLEDAFFSGVMKRSGLRENLAKNKEFRSRYRAMVPKSDFFPWDLNDPEDLTTLKTLLHKEKRETRESGLRPYYSETVLTRIFNEQPELFFEKLPEFVKALDVIEPVPVVRPGRDYYSFEFTQKPMLKVLETAEKKQPFSPWQKAYIKHFTEVWGRKEKKWPWFIYSDPWCETFSHFFAKDPELFDPWLTHGIFNILGSNRDLRRLLDANRSLRRQVLDRLIQLLGDSQKDDHYSYPWDFSQEEDVLALQRMYSTGTGRVRRTAAAYLDQFANENPEGFRKTFPDLADQFDLSPFPHIGYKPGSWEDREPPSWTVGGVQEQAFGRFKYVPYEKLSVADQKALEETLNQPLAAQPSRQDTMYAYLIHLGGHYREQALQRLAHPRPGDSGSLSLRVAFYQERSLDTDQILAKSGIAAPWIQAIRSAMKNLSRVPDRWISDSEKLVSLFTRLTERQMQALENLRAHPKNLEDQRRALQSAGFAPESANLLIEAKLFGFE